MKHNRAFIQVYSNTSYDQLVQAFKNRHEDTKKISMESLMGQSQDHNEDVLMFRDQLLNDALPFQPKVNCATEVRNGGSELPLK
jgi:hypothetical protein